MKTVLRTPLNHPSKPQVPCTMCGGNDVEDIMESLCEACRQCEAAGQFLPSTTNDSFLVSYLQHTQERAAMAQGIGIAPKPLTATQVHQLLKELKTAPNDNVAKTLVDILATRVPPGVDDAAAVKAEFLARVANKKASFSTLSREHAIELLGTMQGGYNVAPLVGLLEDPDPSIALLAADQLKHTLLVFDAISDVAKLHKAGNQVATQVLESWAKAEWFLERPALPEKLTVTIFKVVGETNTDDLSPAPNAWSRPDIPLHALSMLKNKRPGLEPLEDGSIGPLGQLMSLKKKGFPLAFTGEVVGTGSSRKSATNSVLWHMGEDIPSVPNIKRGGICLGGKIAPIFYNTMEDSGALPIELDVSALHMGDVVDIYPYQGRVFKYNTDEMLTNFELKTGVVLDEVRAGGRIPLIVGRSLTTKARKILGLSVDISGVFHLPVQPEHKPKAFTLAQKIVGKACGTMGVVPGQYCEPHMSSVGSQDTTGPMTRDELRSLACIKFSADLVMQSFCHTAAYPKPVDVKMHQTLPDFFRSRGGIALRPGDGIIHAWLNRMVLPDTVGTGGDSHTRFPIGISFPAGSGLVAFAAATGIMPLDMPESVLVKFTGTMQPGITLRDLVQAIPYTAIQKGLLTVEKEGKKNIFSGRILEIEGLSHLQCEQAFELSCAAAERSAAACTVKLNREPVVEFVRSNVTFLKWMISMGYGDEATLRKRIAQMEDWLTNPILLEADPDAEYAAMIEINMDDIKEPVLALPNDPDACSLLSEKAGTPIDEAFVGSCMTNISHFRIVSSLLGDEEEHVPTRLWLTPPTKMDNAQLRQEGSYGSYCAAGARTEIPGCSLCMGNQARCKTGTTIISTSTRNFPNRLGQDTKVYLASAAVTTIAAILGRLPTVGEYMQYMEKLNGKENEIYCYLRFDQMLDFNPELKSDKNNMG